MDAAAPRDAATPQHPIREQALSSREAPRDMGERQAAQAMRSATTRASDASMPVEQKRMPSRDNTKGRYVDVYV
jgi:hypothetical protein